MIPSMFTVRSKRREYAGVATLSLEPGEDATGVTAATPGQFAMLYAFGVGEIPISFSALPATRTGPVFTVRDAGAVSAAIAQSRRGDVVGVRGPFGAGWPMDTLNERDVIVVAGGLGLAPLRPVVQHFAARRDRTQFVSLLYGARTPSQIVFKSDLERWRKRTDINVRVTVDSAELDWRGEVGMVTNLIPTLNARADRTTALVCGPEIMMRHSAEALIDAGVPMNSIWLSMERNMKCAVGLCGHCQFGPRFVCKDGPVFRYDRIRENLFVREL